MGQLIQLSELQNWVGRETGVSDWLLIDQPMINAFADITQDWQPIHIDPEQARASSFGGTIAHGFLTVSLLSKFSYEAALGIEGVVTGINYGFNKIRMLSPVPTGARVRGRFAIKSYEVKSPTRVLVIYDVAVEIEGAAKPALIAEWITMQQLGEAIAPADTHNQDECT